MADLPKAEQVRKRPGMFIGDTRDGSGLTHMVWEVVANAVDEHLAGACHEISVVIEADGAVTVADDGRGFPTELVEGKSLAERVLTTFHDAPTADGHAPHTHVGLHGVGIFVVCALSTSLQLQVERAGRRFAQNFAQGFATSPWEDVGPALGRGTRVTFMPDPTIFSGRALDGTRVLERLTELSFLLPTLKLRYTDNREHVLVQPRGLQGHLDDNADDSALVPTFALTESVEDISVAVAARWGVASEGSIQSFANTERTTSGGTHVQGLLAGLSAGLKSAAPDFYQRCPPDLRAQVLTENLKALVCVNLNDPTYDSPTKSKLSTPRVRQIVKASVARAFAQFLNAHPRLIAHFENALRQ